MEAKSKVNYSQANCAGMNPSLFFPERGSPPHVEAQVREAKAVCYGCVIRKECLDENLREEFGVWGGTTPRERRKIRRQRKLAPPPKPENPKKEMARQLRSHGYSVAETAQALDISEWWVIELTKGQHYPRVVKPKDRDYCWRCNLEKAKATDGLCQACSTYRRKYGRLPSEGVIVQRNRLRDARRAG